jgi:hypothetical protein
MLDEHKRDSLSDLKLSFNLVLTLIVVAAIGSEN